MKLYKYMRAIEYDKDENYIISPKLLNALIGSKIFSRIQLVLMIL